MPSSWPRAGVPEIEARAERELAAVRLRIFRQLCSARSTLAQHVSTEAYRMTPSGHELRRDTGKMAVGRAEHCGRARTMHLYWLRSSAPLLAVPHESLTT